MPAGGSAVWFWMTGPEATGPELAGLLRERVEAPRDVRGALGPPRPGLEGFRESHLCAVDAQRVLDRRDAPGPWLAGHADVDVVALLTARSEPATWFVRDQLGDLAADDERTAELRETLLAYLAFGRSRASATALLHVAPTTVAYRVRRAEELLPGPLPEDPVRVRPALEMHRHLPA